jgi:hypothetical protein
VARGGDRATIDLGAMSFCLITIEDGGLLNSSSRLSSSDWFEILISFLIPDFSYYGDEI